MLAEYVIAEPNGKYYHRRDTGSTGVLLCGIRYLMGLDEFLSQPPQDRELCPRCARVLREREQGITRPQLIGGEGRGQ
jgi:hypothetical protein